MENLAGLLLEDSNIGAKEYKIRDQRPTTTPLQIAYENQKDSNFFDRIPAEIRNKIYGCLLIAHEIITPKHRSHGLVVGLADQHEIFGDFSIGDKLAAGLHGAVARACRACVYETYPILYGQNIFSFGRQREFDYFMVGGLTIKPCKS
jgi:hypothetical protein